jgi:hypothetical protein
MFSYHEIKWIIQNEENVEEMGHINEEREKENGDVLVY